MRGDGDTACVVFLRNKNCKTIAVVNRRGYIEAMLLRKIDWKIRSRRWHGENDQSGDPYGQLYGKQRRLNPLANTFRVKHFKKRKKKNGMN